MERSNRDRKVKIRIQLKRGEKVRLLASNITLSQIFHYSGVSNMDLEVKI
jgi:hypothetical protein